MKVAFLSYSFGREKSSIGKYGWHLANELRKLDVCVDIFQTKFHIKTLGPPIFYLKNAFLRLEDYDIVHSNEGAGVFLHHPCMIETYHHDYKQPYDINSLTFHKLEMLQCHKVRHIIVPSFATKKALLRYGFKEDKISVIHHGVDHSVFRKKNSRVLLKRKYGILNHFVVINVGTFIKRKRQNDIIEALAGIPDTVLILVGRGEEEKNIKELTREKKVKLLHFKYVPESFLVDLYNVADVYIHTSVLEGFGLTVLEAMACGLPVIAYKTADLGHIIDNAGYLTNVGDIEGIRSALWLLYKNSDVRKERGQNAIDRSKGFSWSETAKKHAQVYKNALHQVWK